MFKPKQPTLQSLISETLAKSRIALFEVRLEKESAIAREATLMARIERLEKEEKDVQ